MKRPVLIVSHESRFWRRLEPLLAVNGYATITTASSVEALGKARESRPRAVVWDVMMPVREGIEFRLAQQGDPSIAHIPVVVVSAHQDVAKIASRLTTAGLLVQAR